MLKDLRNYRWFTWLVFLLVVVGIGLYLRANAYLLESVGGVSWRTVALLVLLRALFLLLNGVTLKLFVRRFGVELRWPEWVGLTFATTLGNYITPFSGGLVARATYLKAKHRLPFTQFAALLAASYVVIFGVSALLGLLLLAWLGAWGSGPMLLTLFFVSVLAGLVVVLTVPLDGLLGRNGRFLQSLHAVLVGWQQLRRDLVLLGQLFGITLLSMTLNGWAFWVAYRALGLTAVSFPAAMLVSLSDVYSVLVNLTPGNLGIREALVGLTSELIALGAGEGLLVALLLRVGTLASVFTLGPLFSLWLARQIGGPVRRR